MSWWSSLNPWAARAPADPDMDAMEHMHDTAQVRQKLTLQYMQHLQRAEKLEGEAKTLSRDKKLPLAKAKLQQSRHYRTLAQQALGQLNNLEHVQLNVESAATNVEVMGVMRDGTHHMSAMMQQLSVEDVDDVTDALQENASEVSEMSSALSRPIFDAADDEDDIDAQLREWQDETDVLQAQRATEQLPDAPTTAVHHHGGGNGGGNAEKDKSAPQSELNKAP